MVLLNLYRLEPSSSSSSSSGGADGKGMRGPYSSSKENEIPSAIGSDAAADALLLQRCYDAVYELAQGVLCCRSSKLQEMLRDRVNGEMCQRIRRVVRYMLLPCSRDLDEAALALKEIFGALHKLHLYAKLLSSREAAKRALIEAYGRADIYELQTLISGAGSGIFVITNTAACENVLHKCIYDNNILFLSLFCSTEGSSDSHQINQRSRSGESALHLSCRLLRLQAIRMLASLRAADFSALNSKRQSCLHVFLESAVKRHGGGPGDAGQSDEQQLGMGYALSPRGRAQRREYNLSANCACDVKAVTATVVTLIERAGPSSLLREDMHGFDCVDYALSSRAIALFSPVLAAVAALDNERAQAGAARVGWLRYLRAAALMNDAYFVSSVAKLLVASGGGAPAQYAQLLTLSVCGCRLSSLTALLLVPEIAACVDHRDLDGLLPVEAALRRAADETAQWHAEAALRSLLRNDARVHHRGAIFAPPPWLPAQARQLADVDNLFSLCAVYSQPGLLRILLAHGCDDYPSVEPLPGNEGFYLGAFLYRSSPLALAVASGDAIMAELLLLSTPFHGLVDTADPRCGLRPLHLALHAGSTAMVCLLLEHGASLGAPLQAPPSSGDGLGAVDIEGVYAALVARARGEVGGEWEDLAQLERELSVEVVAREHFYKIPFLLSRGEHKAAGSFLLLFHKLLRLVDREDRLRHGNFSKWSKVFLRPTTLFSILLTFFRWINLRNHLWEEQLLERAYDLGGISALIDALVAAAAASEEAWLVAAAAGDSAALVVLPLSRYCRTVQRYLRDSSLSAWPQLLSLPVASAAQGCSLWSTAVRDRSWPLMHRLLPLVLARPGSLFEDSLLELLQEGEQAVPACLRLLRRAISCGAALHSNDALIAHCVRIRAAAPLLLLLAHGFYSVYSPQLWTKARSLLPRGDDCLVRDVVEAYSEYLSHAAGGSELLPSHVVTESMDDLFVAAAALPADPPTTLLRAMFFFGGAAALALAVEELSLVERARSPAAPTTPLLFEVLALAARTQAAVEADGDAGPPAPDGSAAGSAAGAEADAAPAASEEPREPAELLVDASGGEVAREAAHRYAIERVRRGVRDQARLLSGAKVGIIYGGCKIKYI